MQGLDLLGADEGGLIDTGAAAAKGLVAALKKKSDAPVVPAAPPPEPPPEPWYSKALVGPVKVWHAIAGAVVVVGGVVLWPRGRK